VAETLSKNLRSFDSLCRWGGEEFLGIISRVDADQLRSVAEKLRGLVESASLMTEKGNVQVTISIGGALAGLGESIETVIERADSLLYRSKDAGRNRISME
jgi:diguanylate cyclase (GGDEF)-like protein